MCVVWGTGGESSTSGQRTTDVSHNQSRSLPEALHPSNTPHPRVSHSFKATHRQIYRWVKVHDMKHATIAQTDAV